VRISRDVARRFLLGRQGLWPGRRWRGIRGTEQAMRTMEHVQLDPLQVIARAQDLALHSRVIDYHPDDSARLTYEKRRFFEWGATSIDKRAVPRSFRLSGVARTIG